MYCMTSVRACVCVCVIAISDVLHDQRACVCVCVIAISDVLHDHTVHTCCNPYSMLHMYYSWQTQEKCHSIYIYIYVCVCVCVCACVCVYSVSNSYLRCLSEYKTGSRSFCCCCCRSIENELLKRIMQGSFF